MKAARLTRSIISLFFIITILSIPAGSAYACDVSQAPGDTLLQFTSAGHVAGFDKTGIYLAGLDHTLRVEFAGGHMVQPVAESTVDATGSIQPLARVTYKNTWDNIDIIYTALDGGIAESTYVLHPGADPASIRLRYNTLIEAAADGGLSFLFTTGSLEESAPIAWQEIGGQRIPVSIKFTQQDSQQAGFALGDYNRDYTLYIDPVYRWHTFYGGGGTDAAYQVARDLNGNIYASGSSSASWNGPSGQAPLHAYNAGIDILVIKLDRSGNYLWHTFYGGAGDESGMAIALDTNGDAVLTGGSPIPWNGPAGQAPLHAYNAGQDIFILKLNTAGAYLWHTYYGTGYSDYGTGIAMDTAGSSYISAFSSGSWRGPAGQLPIYEEDGNHGHEITVIKLDRTGAYLWHTFHGQDNGGRPWGIALNPLREIYVTGQSYQPWEVWTGTEWKQPLNAFPGGDYDRNMFVLKLNNAGGYNWHTFFGSAGGIESGTNLTCDQGSIYITGYSNKSWNGANGQSPLHAYSSNDDITVLKLDSTGSYGWHTFYGTSGYDVGYDIATGPGGEIYVAGVSTGSWNGPEGQQPLHPYTGAGTAITLIKLNSSGAYGWHDFYGKDSTNYGRSLATSRTGFIILAGFSNEAWNGPDGQAPLHAFNAGSYNYKLYVLKLGGSIPPVVLSVTPESGKRGETLTAVITGNYFDEVTAVSFGEGITVNSYSVDSVTQITASITISGSAVLGNRPVSVTTTLGSYSKENAFRVLDNGTMIGTGSHSSTLPDSFAPVQNTPVSLSNITVKSASLSSPRVTPGTPVTVTANVVNTGTGNGTSAIKVSVNGEHEAQQGVAVNSGGSSTVTFNITRNDPGTYTVYAGGVNAGSFIVDQFTPDAVLYLSGAMVLLALVMGMVWVTRRRRS